MQNISTMELTKQVNSIDLPRPRKDILVGILMIFFGIVSGVIWAIMRRGIESITFGQRVFIVVGVLIMLVLAGWSARLSTGYVYDGQAPIK